MNIKQSVFGLGVLLAIGASSAQAQIVPGFQIRGQGVNPYTGGVKTIQQTYNPILGTQSYQSFVNPYTGFSVERQYTLSPFGNSSSVWVNPGVSYYNPYVTSPNPYNPYGYNPYGVTPYYGGYYDPFLVQPSYNAQISAYNYGILVNRMRSNPRFYR